MCCSVGVWRQKIEFGMYSIVFLFPNVQFNPIGLNLKTFSLFWASIIEYLYHRYKKDIILDIFRNKIYIFFIKVVKV